MGFESTRLNGIPVWLDGEQARGYEGALGAQQDEWWDNYKASIKLRWPLAGCVETTDDEGLYRIGETRQILRAPPEPGEPYMGRLAGAHERWYWAGTKAGLQNVFEPFYPDYPLLIDPVRFAPCSLEYAHLDDGSLFYKHHPPETTFVKVVDFSDIDDIGPIGPGDDYDHYSRAFICLTSTNDSPWDTDADWDDPGDYDDGGLWDTTMTIVDVQYMLRMIRRWKGPSCYPVFIAVQFANKAPFWCSPGEWDDGGDWEYEPESDPLYITVGEVWHQEAGLGGWLGWTSPQLTDLWDDTGTWCGYVDPDTFGAP